MNEFYLPQIKKVTINNYSLYECPLIIDFSSKLNIVYGTNGTGKSTLLMIILFSIIGPYRGSVKTQYRKNQRIDHRPLYVDCFFRDRMTDDNCEATVVSEFEINNDNYIVTHSLNTCTLLSVTKNNIPLTGKIVTYKTYEDKLFKVGSDYENYLVYKYQKNLNNSTNLPGGMNTLISMLRDVMFFSESRNLAFWESDLQELVIGKYIVDADFYEKYCDRKLETKALESAYKKKSETLNFMSKFLENERKEIGNYNENDQVSLRIKLNEIDNNILSLNQKLKDEQYKYRKIQTEILRNSIEEEKLREKADQLDNDWYENLFPSQYDTFFKKFNSKMLDNECPICGHIHKFNLKMDHCIMCNEKLILNKNTDLISIDIERKNISMKLYEIRLYIKNLKKELKDVLALIDDYKNKINELNNKRSDIEVILEPNKNAIEDNDNKRLEKARRDRDDALIQLNKSKKEEENMKRIIEQNLLSNFNVLKNNFLNYSKSFFGASHEQNLVMPFSEDSSVDELLIKFYLDGKPRDEKLNDYSEKSVRDDEVFNIAMNISKKNNHVVLVKTSGVFALFNNGEFDLNFKNLFINRQQIYDDYKRRKNINELEFAFESYHLERKHRGCNYIIEKKVSDDISEQFLKTDLFHYLDKNTTLHPINEACTSLTNDEESVDIALIDVNGEIAIIEVKYFVMKGFFQNPNKSAYSKSRFKDGYKQLDKYCVHLDDDKNKIHSAYLYMFYAHSDSIEKINACSKDYYDTFVNNEEKCSISFRRHYKSTFCDNMVDVK